MFFLWETKSDVVMALGCYSMWKHVRFPSGIFSFSCLNTLNTFFSRLLFFGLPFHPKFGGSVFQITGFCRFLGETGPSFRMRINKALDFGEQTAFHEHYTFCFEYL